MGLLVVLVLKFVLPEAKSPTVNDFERIYIRSAYFARSHSDQVSILLVHLDHLPVDMTLADMIYKPKVRPFCPKWTRNCS